MKHPLIVAPNFNMGEHLCSIFNIPKQMVRSANINMLRGLGRDDCVMVYTEGWDNRETQFNGLIDNLEIGGCTIIYVPEIMRVNRS